eukprot:15054467-Heterocapsa_arctica.AAC.1
MASLLFGTEARGVPPSAVQHMQVFVGKCERRLFFGPGGSTKDMVGKYTQADVRAALGTLTVKTEIDNSMA